MIRIFSRLCAALLMALSLCACKEKPAVRTIDASNPDMQKLIEAYQQKDWPTVASIGDTLYNEHLAPDVARLYAEALTMQGRVQQAKDVLDRQIARHPDDYYLLQTRGDILAVAGLSDSALASYDRVIVLRPSYARPYMCEGEIYEARGDTARAIARYLEAARLFAANGFRDETLEYCGRILRLDETHAEAKQLLLKVKQ